MRRSTRRSCGWNLGYHVRNHQPLPLDSAKGSPDSDVVPHVVPHVVYPVRSPQLPRRVSARHSACPQPLCEDHKHKPQTRSPSPSPSITSTILSYQPDSLVGFTTQPWSLESSQGQVLASLNQLLQEYQAGKTTQANILLKIEKANGLCKDISRPATVETSQQEILAAVRALKPSAMDERANQATNGMMSANLKKNR
ncbi:hypothetical protein NOF04DRAFT_6622 [Fusarium oxysporum II5]|uniref:Uncharacterized protein n=1 Tax=Fusarium odoratissimum (strain NRRL 54006) TaxID=1089451 RepID=X0JAL9_FUSO5|nr:uncharacterized protein FOIG_09766 [Fusarium odoratissimum NRRL 54006]EXL98212.1 hypothetical protein FOIG_09766 [Fusarium odoratissimum NRRL 54006]KAK2124106.1 hypothetical protein NOF04DRAFT_6622 [Fusarium oxysporum II5]